MINALISKTNGPANFAKFKAFNKLKGNVCFNRKQRLVFVFIFILILMTNLYREVIARLFRMYTVSTKLRYKFRALHRRKEYQIGLIKHYSSKSLKLYKIKQSKYRRVIKSIKQ